MPKYVSRADVPHFIPLIGKIVAPGEVFDSPVELNNGNFVPVAPDIKKGPAKPVED